MTPSEHWVFLSSTPRLEAVQEFFGHPLMRMHYTALLADVRAELERRASGGGQSLGDWMAVHGRTAAEVRRDIAARCRCGELLEDPEHQTMCNACVVDARCRDIE